MPNIDNMVAVDWRTGKDKIYFFFKDTNTYSRFDIADNRVDASYPSRVSEENWGQFHHHAQNLRFGFTTTGLFTTQPFDFDSDILWLFYYEGDTPMVCKYDQDLDQVERFVKLTESPWQALTPYFDRIVAGTWRVDALHTRSFEFLLNDGHYLNLDLVKNELIHQPIMETTWPGLEPYKDRIITAVQNDRTWADSHYYIFLTNNEYLRYNLATFKLLAGPIKIDETSWPGLLSDQD
ncbi:MULTISPECIES: hypothetical protein [Pseudomonas]|uniref:Hemopexin n=1 Tax=Pseudomonas koreensis TaxID=198620 RepID=A0AA94EQG6_9PSED|nr:hypothetical protein [Pseudomonas koreensis]RVD77989.1 hypothetical protein A9HBioS_1834 [Pseudomonas koreensis]